jgi:beta-glucanase (GH16 family)
MAHRWFSTGLLCTCLLLASLVTAAATAGASLRGQSRCSHSVRERGHRYASGCRRGVRKTSIPTSRRGRHARRYARTRLRPASDASAPSGLILFDEFNGPAGATPDPTKWSYDTGGRGWGNEELESYTRNPENAGLDGQGDLAITARAETYTGPDGIRRQYTSARLQTLYKLEFQYGLLEARIKVPAGQGLVGQFWALGNDAYHPSGWPASGEIDAMEVLGSRPETLHGTLHASWPWAPHGVAGTERSSSPLSDGFHVYGVQWMPDRISFLLDGSVYRTITPSDLRPGAPWPFRHPYFLLLDLAVGGVWPGSPDAETHFPARMLVDWVRVWR